MLGILGNQLQCLENSEINYLIIRKPTQCGLDNKKCQKVIIGKKIIKIITIIILYIINIRPTEL